MAFAPQPRRIQARRARRGRPAGDVAVLDLGDAAGHRLAARHVRLGSDDREVVADLSVDIPPGRITSIVGANACGKSTLLRGLARLLRPRGGAFHLDGVDIHRMPTREVATRLGILPQQPVSPEGITVADLGKVHGVDKSTISRRMHAIHKDVLAAARRHLVESARIDPAELESLERLLRSGLYLSIERLLRA